MSPEQFAYWLNGFVELNPNAMLTLTQWQIVKDHLALVHQKVTPNRVADRFQWHMTDTTQNPFTMVTC
jgi:hypothetical protein